MRGRLFVLLTLAFAMIVGSIGPAVAASASTATGEDSNADSSTNAVATETVDDGEATSVLQGQVVDGDGNGIDNISVKALPDGAPDADPVASAITYENAGAGHGGYSLHVPAGSYLIQFSSNDWGTQYETVWYGGGAGTPVTVGSRATIPLDTTTLVRDTGAPVSGTVVADGEPLAGVRVELIRRSPDLEYSDAVDWVVTNGDGEYVFKKVNRTKPFTVRVDGSYIPGGGSLPYGRVYLGGAITLEDAEFFTLPQGSTGTTLTPFVMTRGVAIIGRTVQDPEASNAWVNVELLARTQNGTWSSVGTAMSTTGRGTYAFGGVRPGITYTVRATSWDAAEDDRYTYLGDTHDRASAQSVVPTRDSTRVPEIHMPKPRTAPISGAVLDDTGTGVPGVEVSLQERRTVDGSTRLVTVGQDTSDSRGHYSFRYVSSGSFTVKFDGTDVGLGWRYLGDTQVEAQASFLTYDGGAAVTVPTSQLSPSRASVHGRVVLDQDEIISQGSVRVALYRWDETARDFVRDWSRDTYGNYGRYQLHDLPPGDYTLQVSYDDMGSTAGYAPAWLGGTRATGPGSPGAFKVEDSDDDLTLPTVTLVKGPVLSGQLTNRDGSQYAGGGYVLLERWEDSQWIWTAGTSASLDGFAVGNLPSGTYRMSVSDYSGWSSWLKPYATSWYGGARPTTGTGPGTFTVVDGEAKPGMDIVLDPGVKLSGRVTTADGSPVAGATVSVSEWRDGWRSGGQSAVTNARGRYTVPVTPGSYWLQVSRNGFDTYYHGDNTWPMEQTTANSIAVGPAGAGLDVELDPHWGDVGAVAGQRLGYCLQNSWGSGSMTPQLSGGFSGLYINRDGSVSEEQWLSPRYRPELLDAQGGVGILAPLMDRNHTNVQASGTWGVSPDGDTLCVIRTDRDIYMGGSTEDAKNTTQMLVEKAATGGYDVTYNYDQIVDVDEPVAGWASGAGEGHVIEGDYLDTSDTALVKGSMGTDVPGRYKFHVEFDDDKSGNIYLWRHPRVVGDVMVGTELSAAPPRWSTTTGSSAEVDIDYVWFGNATGRRTVLGRGATYTPTDANRGSEVWVVAQASGKGLHTDFAASRKVTVPGEDLPPLEHTTAPSLTGAAQVGQVLEVDPGTWETNGAGSPEFTYRWKVGGRPVVADSLGGNAYTLQAGDVGKYVSVYVTATKDGYRSGKATLVSDKVVSADATFGSLDVTVKGGSDSGPAVSGAHWFACEQSSWNCLWGTTDAHGRITISQIPAAAEGTTYILTVTPPNAGDLRSGALTTTVFKDQLTEVGLVLETVTPQPKNVEVPTATRTQEGQPVVTVGQPIDFTVEGCRDVTDPAYTVRAADGKAVATGRLAIDESASEESADIALFRATIRGVTSTGSTTIETNLPATCEEGDEPTAFSIYIDPSGVVTDQYGRPLVGATVTLLSSDSPGGSFLPVPDGSDVMSEDNRQNPDLTDDTGFFRWDVVEGWYQVRVESDGCQTYTTAALPVPPPAIDLLLKLDCTTTAPRPSDAPTVKGTPEVGQILTSTVGTWPEGFETSRQWLRDGEPIPGATGVTYKLTADDHGSRIRVRHVGQRPTYLPEAGRGTLVTFKRFFQDSSYVSVPAAPVTPPVTPPATTPQPPPVVVAPPPVVGLPPAVVTKAATKTQLVVPSKAVKSSKAAKVTVKISGAAKPTGVVKIYKGSKMVAKVVLKAADAGKRVVKLGKWKPGKYKLKAKYSGSNTTLPSTSKVVKLVVVKR